MINLAGLPPNVVSGSMTMLQQVSDLMAPYDEAVAIMNPATLQIEIVQRPVTPRVEMLIDMPAAQTVQIFAHRVKPMENPVMLREFTGDDFNALNTRTIEMQVSWEAFVTELVGLS